MNLVAQVGSQLRPRFQAHVFPASVRERELRGAAAWITGSRAVVTAADGFPRHWPSILDAAHLGVEQPIAPARAVQSMDPSYELGARVKAAEFAVHQAQQQFLDYLTPDIHLTIANAGATSIQFVTAGAMYVARIRDGRTEVLSQFHADGLVAGRSNYDEIAVKVGDVVMLASASCFGERPQKTLTELSRAHSSGRISELFGHCAKSVDQAGAAVVITF